MFASSVILSGTVEIEGLAFRWSVTDGLAQNITVSHSLLGTKTRVLKASPDAQAREIGREMLQACGVSGHRKRLRNRLD